jgi:ATP-dependent DNA helicase DinG
LLPLAELALGAFERMVAATPGFRARPGQQTMAQQIAQALSNVTLGEQAQPNRSISVIQAGTGVGKSAAYLSTGVALALALKTRLVISTATVALQDQLMSKDLPALAAVLETPLVYALAKGRGRYVCLFKLERLAGDPGAADDELFEMEEARVPVRPAYAGAAPAIDPQERRIKLYDTLSLALAGGTWDGDRDKLAVQPEPIGRRWRLSATPARRGIVHVTVSAVITRRAASWHRPP